MNGNNILGRQRGGTARRVPTSSEVPVIEIRGHARRQRGPGADAAAPAPLAPRLAQSD